MSEQSARRTALSHEQRAAFERAISGLGSHGDGTSALISHLRQNGPDCTVLDRLQRQPEMDLTIGQYISRVVSDVRVTRCRGELERADGGLREIEVAYGVPRAVLVGIWAMESDFGARMGDVPVARALATLAACDPKRAAFWRDELAAFARICETDGFTPQALTGSWAGAMGQTQLMPSTLQHYGVDFDNDGQRDIWSPTDGLASAANYLRQMGWPAGCPWGFEVNVPPDFDFAGVVAQDWRAWTGWTQAGVRAVCATSGMDDRIAVRIIAPEGAGGPIFAVTRGFEALLAYNRSLPYAVSAGLLADRMSGAAPLTKPWLNVSQALDRAGRSRLQQRLVDLGWDTGGVDGIVGPATRRIVFELQRRWGETGDGYPTAEFLQRVLNDTDQAAAPVSEPGWHSHTVSNEILDRRHDDV